MASNVQTECNFNEDSSKVYAPADGLQPVDCLLMQPPYEGYAWCERLEEGMWLVGGRTWCRMLNLMVVGAWSCFLLRLQIRGPESKSGDVRFEEGVV